MDLREIGDRLEIEAVLHRYARAVDDGDWALLDTVFVPDAEIDYTATGGIAGRYPQVRAWLAEVLPAFFPRRMHTLGQIATEFDTGLDTRFDTGFDTGLDRARVTAYFHNPMPAGEGDGARLLEYGGRYHHLMVRTEDGWRSRRLREELVWRRESRTAP